jgi:hypothetical protein
MSNSFIHHPSSYRDPSGFIFEKDRILYRQVNKIFKPDFDLFINSGCYENLVKKNLLIPHEVIPQNLTGSDQWYSTLKPERIAFTSYPYEWSFDMLKDAALLTLRLVKESIGFGLILKDATPYNIQWHDDKFIFIDTLSFEKYNEEEPWIAYRQFCENFLSPLLLMHYSKNALQQLLLAYPDGIPLGIAKSLLPWRSKFSFHTYLHIHLHATIANKKKFEDQKKIYFSKQKLKNLITSLEGLIGKLKLPTQQTAWSGYYEEASQRENYLAQKKEIIQEWLKKTGDIKTAADLGANDGEFSRLLSVKNIQTIAADFDPYCINRLYLQIKESGEKNIQPLVIDLANPTPAIGVNNEERASFQNRIKVDMVLALALIHHLTIGKNIPFYHISKFFSAITKQLIIEFIPKTDPKVQLMLKQKRDIYDNYNEQEFIKEFETTFSIEKRQEIPGSGRILFLMKKNHR